MPGKQAKVVTPPMLKRMLRHISRSSSFPARDRAMIPLSLKAGLRACEIAGLDWSMLLDAQGRVSGTIHVRDVIGKKRGGRRIPMHPDLQRALRRLARTTKPVGPVIRSYRGSHLKANSIVNWFVALFQELGFEGCLSHSGRRSFSRLQHSSFRLQLARRATARRPQLHRNDRTVHRRRHLCAEAVGGVRLGERSSNPSSGQNHGNWKRGAAWAVSLRPRRKGPPLKVLAGGQGTERRAARIHVLDRQRASQRVDLYLRRKGPAAEFDLGGAMATTIVVDP
jgi:integrase/recombinase XerD